MNRREFMQAGALGLSGLVAGYGRPLVEPRSVKTKKINFLFIICDQLNLDAISAYGNPNLSTPNLDRLVRRGVSFMQSYSTNPVCSPARSSLMTGRMPSETGVVSNDRPILKSIPNMGQWLRAAGYETAYCGKWHLPEYYPTTLPGFDVIPMGGGQGDLTDGIVSRQCESYLLNCRSHQPFLLVASLLQPHDICFWANKNVKLVPKSLRFDCIKNQLPELPPNHTARPEAPAQLAKLSGYYGFDDLQWRYYLYIYYRQVEMLDANIGRILDALEDSGQSDNTVILFTSDHGEGAGRHMNVQKWYPYDEASRIPMIVSCPDVIPQDVRDTTHLVSGLDILPTICDFAGVDPPNGCKGLSTKGLLEDRQVSWRTFVPIETHVIGRTVRTENFKYVKYKADPVEQLFDMKTDPWEMKNIYHDPVYSDVIRDHRKILSDWESSLATVEPTKCLIPNVDWLQALLDIEYGKNRF